MIVARGATRAFRVCPARLSFSRVSQVVLRSNPPCRLTHRTNRSAFFFDNSGGYTTSVAILNPFLDASGQVVRLRFRDESGAVLYEQPITLANRSRMAVVTAEWAPATVGKRGTLSIETEGSGITAFGLLFNSNGPFSTLLSSEDR